MVSLMPHDLSDLGLNCLVKKFAKSVSMENSYGFKHCVPKISWLNRKHYLKALKSY